MMYELLIICALIASVESCGMGVFGLRTLFLWPVGSAISITAAAFTAAIAAPAAVMGAITGQTRRTNRRTADLLRRYSRNALGAIGNERFQQFYQFLYEESKVQPTIQNIIRFCVCSLFNGKDIYEAEKLARQAVTIALAQYSFTEPEKLTVKTQVSLDMLELNFDAWPMEDRCDIGTAYFVLGLTSQYQRKFVQSWVYYDIAALFFLGANTSRMVSREEQIRAQIATMTEEELRAFLVARNVDISSATGNEGKLRKLLFQYRDFKIVCEGQFSFTQTDSTVNCVTYDMALNGSAYARFLYILYSDCEPSGKFLQEAIHTYKLAIEAREQIGFPEDLMYKLNLAKALYYESYNCSSEQETLEMLRESRDLFDYVSIKEDFQGVSRAEAYSMMAQCYARENNLEKYDEAVCKATSLDPRVIVVNPEEAELSAPWPLPEGHFVPEYSAHEFVSTPLPRPRWCDCCFKFIRVPLGYKCSHCSCLVHSGCVENAKQKLCWSTVQSPNPDDITSPKSPMACSHTHKLFVKKFLHHPTWCSVCEEFIKNPRNNYRCTDCQFVCHSDCFNGTLNAIVVLPK